MKPLQEALSRVLGLGSSSAGVKSAAASALKSEGKNHNGGGHGNGKKKPKKQKATPLTPANHTPDGDGVDHINIHVDGKTELGRMLSTFHRSQFTHPWFGPFNSMEGFWFYIKTKEKPDELRMLSGLKAKKLGKSLTRQWVENFTDIITAANYFKIEQNPHLKKLFLESTLPFDHYYLHGPGKVMIRPKGHEWLVAGFEQIRQWMREGKRPPEIDYQSLVSKPSRH